ncbi:MAG: Coenzyme F420 hydrogenase/dehydrogenase, beta subunit C-terminal domain [Methanomicrobia archaeon]|nr:Coenzyme F420 hydrogenase/dehydrogenase, beta subunit C-terminal domain [Methanomicrobia archaeon]
MSTVSFEIDGKKVTAEEGTTILEAAKEIGIAIPTLCYHPLVEPFGACRLCSVKITKRGRSKVVTACNYPVEKGLIVETNPPEIVAIRKMLIELLLARCPTVEILQDLAKEYGVEKPRFTKEDETCILCGLCTRICDERVGVSAINFVERGIDRAIEGPLEEPLGVNLSEVCIGCGACAYVCPTGTIKVEDLYRKIRSSFPFAKVEERTFGRQRAEDEIVGIYKNAYAVRSTDAELLKKAQDGGAVTALLGYALDAGILDCAAITVADRNWEPSAKVARSSDDFKDGAGTKYTVYPSGIGLLEAAAAGCDAIGFVGTPCQIGGIRKVITSDQPYGIAKAKIKLLIGLFCMETFKQELMAYFEEKVLPLEAIKKLDIKGKEFRVYDQEGNLHVVPFGDVEGYGNTGCFVCSDYTAELADISVGSVGSEPGWSTVLTRTERGEDLLKGAEAQGYIEVTGDVDLKEIKRLTKYKRKRAADHEV